MLRQTPYHLRRLTRRIILFAIVPALFLLALRLIWGYQAAHRLQNVLDQIKAAGIHMDVSDFPDASTIPSSQNGIDDWLEAFRLFAPTSAEEQTILLSNHDQSVFEAVPSPAEAAEIQRILAASRPVMDLLDRAGDRSAMVLPRAVLAPILEDFSRTPYRDVRTLTMLCFHAAAAAKTRHDEVEELASLRRMITISRGLDCYSTVFAHVLAEAARAIAVQAIEALEPSLSLRDPASRSAARRMLAVLQDDSEAAASLNHTVPAELVALTHMLPKYFKTFSTWWISPLSDINSALLFSHVLAASPALKAPNWPRAAALLRESAFHEPKTNLDELSDHIESYLLMEWDKPILVHMRTLSDSRAAALLLAAHLYAAEHGSFPKDPAALVPDYLATIPLDPFADGPPLHYRLDPAGPTIWSISENGVDDSAAVRFDSSGGKLQRYGDRPISQGDIIYGAAWRTAVPPTQPATAP